MISFKLGTSVILFSTMSFASQWTFQSATGEVSFLAIGRPGAIRVNGKSAMKAGAPTLTGVLDLKGSKSTLDAVFKMDAFTTGIDLRDKHMKNNYLETGKFATARLLVKNLAMPAECSEDKCTFSKIPFKGELTLHGQTKPVEGKLTGDFRGLTGKLSADFDTELSQHLIPIPAYLGITMAKEASVHADLIWE